MPIMDGFTSSKLIKMYCDEMKSDKAPLICALTAYTTDEFKRKSLDHCMDLFFTKPLSAKDLLNLIDTCKRK